MADQDVGTRTIFVNVQCCIKALFRACLAYGLINKFKILRLCAELTKTLEDDTLAGMISDETLFNMIGPS